jgi:crotonobetaine/carnitine-CoA ligase
MTGRAATHIPPAPDLMPEIGHNLAATLRWAADRYGERSALEFERGEAFTFAGLASRAAGLAEELQARGVRENDVLAVALDNRATFPLLVFAAAQLGALVLPLNPSFRPAELEAIYDVAQPTHAVALAEFCERHARLHHERGMAVLAVDEAAAGHDVLRERDADWDHLGRRDLGERAVWFGLTSGSTGLPKLVAKRQRTWILVGHIMRAICGLEPDDRMLCAQPCYYGDPFFILMGTLQAGATAVMLSRFRSPTFMEHVARRSITKFWSIGAMPTMLLNTAPGPFDRRHGARAAWSVGIPRNRHRELEERFGVRWLEVYGSAEATGVLAETEHSPHVPGEGWLGRIVPTQEVRLVDQAERELTGDAAGVLQVRGPLVATEYHGRPDASAAAFRADGWYHSGDVIERCGDRWRYVRREKDVVRRAGENISCQEVEAVLRAHPGVVDAAVLPKPDPIRQEEVWAFVQRSDGLPADPASTARDVLQFAAERLAPHKLPRFMSFVGDFPRTPSQRVAKRHLSTLAELETIDLAAHRPARWDASGS